LRGLICLQQSSNTVWRLLRQAKVFLAMTY
jgi:hypothetical protein